MGKKPDDPHRDRTGFSGSSHLQPGSSDFHVDQMIHLIKQVATYEINPSRAWPFPAGVLKITLKEHMLALGSPFLSFIPSFRHIV